ncbi:hypothetical protein M0813_25186 [Anaeramoeba flamelloides]|uniref:B box-type domain-containing protein n=1 Tax=Anaeramoeba flamelloides TaxID=1746091 RepID=A0ABQ8Y3A5_9EUKA|nr:hypothetical protein M0813_25186 [Anaeramoeba flamelloides]
MNKTNTTPCYECKSVSDCFCVDCDKHYCTKHSKIIHDLRSFKDHTVVPSHLQSRLEEVKCKTHKDEFLDFYCTKCNEQICEKCAKGRSHDNHKCVDLNKYLKEQKQTKYVKICTHQLKMKNVFLSRVEQYGKMVDVKRDKEKKEWEAIIDKLIEEINNVKERGNSLLESGAQSMKELVGELVKKIKNDKQEHKQNKKDIEPRLESHEKLTKIEKILLIADMIKTTGVQERKPNIEDLLPKANVIQVFSGTFKKNLDSIQKEISSINDRCKLPLFNQQLYLDAIKKKPTKIKDQAKGWTFKPSNKKKLVFGSSNSFPQKQSSEQTSGLFSTNTGYSSFNFSSQPPDPTKNRGGFGFSSNNNSSWGSSNNSGWGSSNNSGWGSSNNSGWGSSNTTSFFGSSTNNNSNWGSSNNSGFGSSNNSGFGSSNTTSLFGSSTNNSNNRSKEKKFTKSTKTKTKIKKTFGSKKKNENEKESKNTKFTFGSNNNENEKETKNTKFTFGSNNTENEKETKNTFTFGSNNNENEKESKNTKFTFGSNNIENEKETKNTFTFGSNNIENEKESKNTFTFGSNSNENENENTQFTFGSNSNENEKETKNTFTFGSNNIENEKETKTTFTFGSNSNENENETKNTFTFGSNNNENKNENKNTFTFGNKK